MFQESKEMGCQLKSLEIKNFKCFKDTDEINFRKLTILTGANSSGKSSIIQAIVGALQSNVFPFLFSTNGKFINMGDFLDVSYKHDAYAEVVINFKIESIEDKETYHIKTGWKKNKTNKLPELSTLEAISNYFDLKMERRARKFLLTYNYYPEKDPMATAETRKTFQSFLTAVLSHIDTGKKTKKRKTPEEISNIRFGPLNIKNEFLTIDSQGLANLPDKLEQVGVRFNRLIDVFNKFSSNFNLISSFRLHPNRTHLEATQDSNKVKKFGEGYLDQIIRWENGNKKKKAELISHLKQLGLLQSIETDRIRGGRYDMLVTTNIGGTKVSLSDVGFGVSQFLPILVADMQLSKDSTLIVAQPEIHLHPKVAAEFATYIVGQISNNSKNYIIETHSECFLNRIRLAIVKGQLKEEDLSVYYFENTKGESKVTELKFNKKGQIENAPKGFFDTYMMDLKEIAFNA